MTLTCRGERYVLERNESAQASQKISGLRVMTWAIHNGSECALCLWTHLCSCESNWMIDMLPDEVNSTAFSVPCAPRNMLHNSNLRIS